MFLILFVDVGNILLLLLLFMVLFFVGNFGFKYWIFFIIFFLKLGEKINEIVLMVKILNLIERRFFIESMYKVEIINDILFLFMG